MLSIRTQNRMALVPYDETIFIYKKGTDKWMIETKSCFRVLGTYATKERALEVLDEIERQILSSRKMFVDEMNHSFEVDYQLIYQMPKE